MCCVQTKAEAKAGIAMSVLRAHESGGSVSGGCVGGWVCRCVGALHRADSDGGVRHGPADPDAGRLLWACAAAWQKVRLANRLSSSAAA